MQMVTFTIQCVKREKKIKTKTITLRSNKSHRRRRKVNNWNNFFLFSCRISFNKQT